MVKSAPYSTFFYDEKVKKSKLCRILYSDTPLVAQTKVFTSTAGWDDIVPDVLRHLSSILQTDVTQLPLNMFIPPYGISSAQRRILQKLFPNSTSVIPAYNSQATAGGRREQFIYKQSGQPLDTWTSLYSNISTSPPKVGDNINSIYCETEEGGHGILSTSTGEIGLHYQECQYENLKWESIYPYIEQISYKTIIVPPNYIKDGVITLPLGGTGRYNLTGLDITIRQYNDEAPLRKTYAITVILDDYPWPLNENTVTAQQYIRVGGGGDPYGPGGTSGPGGGDGNFSEPANPIPIPPIPQAIGRGFNDYFITDPEFLQLIQWLWDGSFDIEGLLKIVNNPIDTIIGAHLIPVQPSHYPDVPVALGNINSDSYGGLLQNRYVQFDCGSIFVPPFSNSFLDYSPNTRFQLFLPFIGFRPINTNDIINKTVSIKYTIDCWTGECVAFVEVNGIVLYSYNGNCASQIPITSGLYNNIISSVIGIGGAVGSLVLTEGASAPAAAGVIASSVVNAIKPSYQRSGSMGGTSGFMGIRYPYLVKERVQQAVPNSQNEFIGYPVYTDGSVSDFKGYTLMEEIHLNGVLCTEIEKDELEEMCKKEGVIL